MEMTQILSDSLEAGAALVGTLQTENLGIEKVVANIVANPNIRFIILCWREAQGHLPAEAVKCLVENGAADDKKRTIIGATAPTPYLANISLEAIERFRKQVTVVNLIREDDVSFGMLSQNVWNGVRACLQEVPTKFEDYMLYDPGAWPEPPICEKLTMRLKEPWRPELSNEDGQVIRAMKEAAAKQSQSDNGVSKRPKRKKEDDDKMLELLGLQDEEE